MFKSFYATLIYVVCLRVSEARRNQTDRCWLPEVLDQPFRGAQCGAAVLRGISPEHWAQLGPTGTQLSSQDMAQPLHFGTADTDMGRNITAGDPQWYHWVLHAAKRC